jgi:hypothetical protein
MSEDQLTAPYGSAEGADRGPVTQEGPSQAQLDCIAQGGKWDEDDEECDLSGATGSSIDGDDTTTARQEQELLEEEVQEQESLKADEEKKDDDD